MRIAQLMLAKGFGGAERSFVDLTAALVRRGHDVLAICERRGQALSHLRRVEGLALAPIGVLGAWDPFALWGIRRRLRAFGPEIVQCHLARAAHLGGRAARALGLPALAKTHNYVDLKYYRAIDRLVPTTADQFAYLRRAGVPETRLAIIPNFSRLTPAAAPRPPARTAPTVGSVGRLVRKKGFDVLLLAVARLRAEGLELRLQLAGDGPERTSLVKLAADLGLNERACFMGWADDVAAALAGVDLFVLPSREEPFGIVVLEAMALGIPIVASRTAGPLEILDADCARFADVDDAADLARAIHAALEDPADSAARAGRALARFADRYTETVVVTQYEAVYDALKAPNALSCTPDGI